MNIMKKRTKKRTFALPLTIMLVIAVAIGGFSLATPASAAASTITVAAGGLNPAAKTIHTTFQDEVLLQFSFNSTGSETMDGIRITPIYTGTGAENDYSLAFYSDVDDDGIVSDGDSLLLTYTTLTATNGSAQLFDFSSNLSLSAATEHNVIVLAKNATADPADGDTLRLNVLAGAIWTVEGDDTQSGTASGNIHTIEADDPDISFADGSGQPAAAEVLKNASNLAIQEWNIVEAAAGTGAGDVVRIVGITPTGTVDESTDITSVQFYIDDGDDTFAAGSDNLLTSSPTTFSANDTKEDFTITGGIQVAQNGTTKVWVVYNLADSASDAETIIQNIVLGADVTMGSGVALANGDVAEGVSNTQTIDAAAPTVSDDWVLNMNAGTITINFSETMDTGVDVDETKITIQESNDTDVAGEVYTLTDSTSAWSDGDTLLVTLSSTDLDAIKSDSGLGVSTITSFLEIVASSGIADDAGFALDLTNVTDAACIDATTFTADTTAPTFTVVATSIDAAGDTIALTFNEPMDVTTITDVILQADTNVTLDYSDDAGNTNEANITVANATVAWTGLTVATITLDEETDLAVIPSGKYIGVTLGSVTDMASVAEAGSEIYTSVGITTETTAPTYTVAGTSVDDAGDTIALTFNEAIAQASLTQADVQGGSVILLDYSDDAGNTNQADITTTNATASWDATGKIFTITLDENTDGSYIPDTKYIGVTLDGTTTDLLANTVATSEIYTSAGVSKETDVPTFTVAGTSVNDAGDTIALTFNEIMDVTTITTAILQAGSNILLDYSDDAGNTNEADITTTNATVAWSVNNTVATITLDEATDSAYLPNSKYVGVTLSSVADLVGNAEAGSEVYTGAGVSKEVNVPTVVVTAVSNDAAGDTVVLTFNEPMNVTTITTAILQADSNITLDYSDDAGNTNAANIVVTNATVAWTGNTVATITLDEETDLAYIPDSKYIGVTLSSVTDLVGNAEAGSEVYTAAGISKETTAPTFTVAGTSITNAGDTIVLTFNEAVDQTTLTQADVRAGTVLALDYSDDAGNTNQADITATNATASWDATGKILTITLDEATDGAYIPDGKYIGVSTDASPTDLVGNTVATTEIYSSAVSKESTIPTFTVVGTSVNAAGDTIALTFSEPMDVTTITTALIQANTNITLDYSDDAGNTNAVDITVTNATVAWTGLTIATITLDEATDLAYIPAGKYIGVTLSSVTDLVGNAEAGSEVYSAAVSAESTAPTLSSWTLNMNTGHLVLTFSEPVDASTLDATAITIQDAATATYGYRALTGGTTASTDGASIDITMIAADLNAIKVNELLAWAKGSSYIIIGTTLIDDLAGNDVTAIADGAGVQATTYTVDSTAPTVSSQYPTDGATGISINVNPYVVFSEVMDESYITNSTVLLKDYDSDVAVTATVSLSNGGTTAVIQPQTALDANGHYYVEVTTGALDMAGVAATAYGTKADQDFYTSTADVATPTVASQTPTDGATSQAITVSPTVTFSEAMDVDTVNTNTVQLRLYSDDSVINSVITYVTGTYVATINPVASLSNNTQYYVWVTGAKDSAGNTVTAYATKADQDFTTVAQGDGSLAVTGVTTTKSYATADGTYANGWAWTFSITVPTSETTFDMKFDDWISGSNTIAVADNMRFYSVQAATAVDSSNAISITASGTYSADMTLSSDLDATTAGRQIEVTVEAKVPSGSSGGSYSTSYGARSS